MANLRVEFKHVCQISKETVQHLDDEQLLSDICYRVGAAIETTLKDINVIAEHHDTTVWYEGQDE